MALVHNIISVCWAYELHCQSTQRFKLYGIYNQIGQNTESQTTKRPANSTPFF